MSEFKQIKPTDITDNTFDLIGNQWMLVTAKKEENVNTMTASWGGIGIMWGKPVAFVFIRPQRFTKEFIDFSQELSLSFLGDSYKKELNYLGSTSGRTEDKIATSGLTVSEKDSIPYFEESHTVITCKALFSQYLEASSFLDKNLIPQFYPDADFHNLYICEITRVLKK